MRRLQQRDIDELFALAQRGGLGHAIAITDCIAEGPDHLMYMEGDTLVLLADSGEDLLAYCEGEVGWVKRSNVRVSRPCASSSSSGSSTTPKAIVPPSSEERSLNSTPSNSAASVQTPHTPGSISSVYSARSSHSTTKSWPSTPYTPLGVSSGITVGHEPIVDGSSVPYLGDSVPAPTLHLPDEEDEKRNKRGPMDVNASPLDAERSFSALSTGRMAHPKVTSPNLEATHRSMQDSGRIPPTTAAPPRPLPRIPSGLARAPGLEPIRVDRIRHRRSSSASTHSDVSGADIEASTGGHGGSDLPYTRAETDRLSPTPTYAATVSLSALGVLQPPTTLSSLPLQSLEHPESDTSTRRVREARQHLIRHVDRRAGNLAVPMEPAYRQSFAAETARYSEVPTELESVYTLAELSVYDDIASPTAEDFNLPPESSLHPEATSNQPSPLVNESEYPATPGTFGLGRTPNESGSPAAQFSKMNLPSRNPPVPHVQKMAPIASVRAFPVTRPEPVLVVEMDQAPPPRPLRHPASLASSLASRKDVGDRSHTHSSSEETVIATPESVPVGSFGDESQSHLSNQLEANEVAQADSSLTDPLPPSPDKQQTWSSMLAPQLTNAPSRPDSPASYDSRWSMESRAAAKAAMRGGFYALGHSPQITESAQQSFQNWAANLVDDKPPIPPLPTALNDSAPTSPTLDDPAQAPSSVPSPIVDQTHSMLSQGHPMNGTPESSNGETGSASATLPFSVTPAPDTSSRASHSSPTHEITVRTIPRPDAPSNVNPQRTSTPPVIPPRRRPVGFVGQLNGDAKENPAPGPAAFLFHKDPGTDVPEPTLPKRSAAAPVPAVPAAAPGAPQPPQPQQRSPPPPTVSPPWTGHARPSVGPRSISNQHGWGPSTALRPHPNLVRRVTSPTTTSFNDRSTHSSQHCSTQDPMNRQQQRLQQRRDMVDSPVMGSNDDHSSQNHGSSVNHSTASHQTSELPWNFLPSRTTSSNDGHSNHARLVSLPSEQFDGNRYPANRSPNRSPNNDTPPKPTLQIGNKGSVSGKHSLDRMPSLTSLARPSLSSPASTNVATPTPKGSFSNSDHGEPTPSPPSLTRGRSRSFSAAIAKSLGKASRKNSAVVSPFDAAVPPVPNSHVGSKEELIGGPIITFKSPPKPAFLRTRSSGSSISEHKASFDSISSARPAFLSNDSSSSISRPWLSHVRAASTHTKSTFRAAPVSHRDYADPTVNADGMEFEIIQPRKAFTGPPVVRTSVDSSDLGLLPASELKGMEFKGMDRTKGSGAESPPELDEWGFIKEISPVPVIFGSRQSPAEVRAAEQKWLNAISSPLAHNQTAPKKVRRMVIEQGVPASLRGRVWGWFMSNGMNGRVAGLFQRLISDEPGPFDEQINRDVETVYSDHSVFYRKGSPGQSDLRTLLRAYVIFAPSGYRTDIARLAGALLIHAVLEDAFWLLAGLFNGVLKSYYVLDTKAFIIDLNVFGGILEGSEPRIGQLFRSTGVLPEHYLVKWWSGMFIRSLPWPTVLRVIDVVISEGPRYLMIAALAIITLSRDRLLALPRKHSAIIDYLHHLPQDSLLLPDTFIQACDQVKLRDEDLKKLRASVKAQMQSRN